MTDKTHIICRTDKMNEIVWVQIGLTGQTGQTEHLGQMAQTG